MENKIFLTIRETAVAANFPEYAIRQRQRQHRLPCIYAGKKCLINYPQFINMLEEESKEAVQI